MPVALRVGQPRLRWQQTPWGRILIGLVLAQGLFYGLRHLLTGVLLAANGGNAAEVWNTLQATLLLQATQVLSLVLGGILAGGGQRDGLVLGAVVGVWNGVLAVLLRQNPAQGALSPIALVCQPLIHSAVAAVGGWIGGLIWKPLPSATAATQARKRPAPRKPSPLAGRIAWLRVAFGAGLAVAGTLSATLIFDKVLDLSAGRLGTSSDLQDRVITWEIKALAVLVGGALAGATTANGLKQGLVVGLGSGLILIAVQGQRATYWLEFAIFTLIGAVSLSLVGGWFGGQLFPPVVKVPRAQGIGPASLS
jgi:hypothetical protein